MTGKGREKRKHKRLRTRKIRRRIRRKRIRRNGKSLADVFGWIVITSPD